MRNGGKVNQDLAHCIRRDKEGVGDNHGTGARITPREFR